MDSAGARWKPNKSAQRFERHRVVILAAVALGAATASDIVATRVGETLAERERRRAVMVERAYRIRSPYYHHDLRPDVSVPAAVWGPYRHPLKTNSLGFKDGSNRTVALRPSGPRLLVIGDSFTEGVGLPYHRTWVGMVAPPLAASGVEVLNAAVATYSPAIYQAKTRYLLEQVGLRFDELVVYLDISDAQNDALWYRLDEAGGVVDGPGRKGLPNLTRHFYERTRPVERFVVRNTRVTRFLLFGLLAGQWPPPRSAHDHTVDDYGGAWTYDPEAFDCFGRRGLEAMTANMDRLAALAKRHRFRLAVAVYPWPGQIIYDTPDSIQVRHWRAWSARRGARFIDHFPDFMGPPRRQTIERCFLPGDFHWSEAGHHRIASRFLADWQAAHPATRVAAAPR